MGKNRFLIIECVSLGAILCSTLAFFGISGFALKPAYGETYLGEFKHKVSLLEKKSEEKRIIFVGGSAVAFGINSKLINSNLNGYKAVNFGLYASLGSRIMMDIVSKNIQDGDLVILMPEQDSQMLSLYFNGESTWQALDGDFHTLKYLSYDNYSSLIASYPKFALSKIKYNFNPLNIDGIYKRDSFNEYGDIESSLRDANIMYPKYYDDVNRVSFDADIISSNFIDYANEFNKSVTKKGGEVFYYFPPMNVDSLIDKSYSSVDDYYSYLCDELDFPIMGNPHNSLMKPLWFYDTNYHLNTSGSVVYTKQVIKDIKVLLNDSSKTEITEPEMPTPVVDEGDGDNSYAECFDYSEKDNGIILTGLKGDFEEVVLPYRINNKIVTSFSCELFKNNKAIKKITFQENITKIDDYSFDGCTNLNSIILKQTLPSKIKIGSNLLDGTNAIIYVPESSLSTYLSDYSWNKYASRISSI